MTTYRCDSGISMKRCTLLLQWYCVCDVMRAFGKRTQTSQRSMTMSNSRNVFILLYPDRLV